MLIIDAKQGNPQAYESLVKKYQRPIYHLCRRMTGTHQSADDLAQETFIKAFFSLSHFKEGMSFFSWIRRIAVNNTLNYLKIRRREEPLGDKNGTVPDNPHALNHESPPERLQRRQMESRFHAALRRLPPDQRSVFILKVIENLSYQEIAQTLNIPHGTVMSRLNRARRKLKQELAEYVKGVNP